MRIIGIDPGGRESGVIARDGDHLLGAISIKGTHDPGQLPGRDSIDQLLHVIEVMEHHYQPHLIAVESVEVPNAHLGRGTAQVFGALSTAVMFGVVVGRWSDALPIPPLGHGRGPRDSYPPDLWGPREGPAGAGKLRHCRAAWDIAATAMRWKAAA